MHGSPHRAGACQIHDPDGLVRDSEWTQSDLVADVTAGTDAYARYLEGAFEPFVDVTDLVGGSLSESNALRLEEESERDIDVLLERFTRRSTALIENAKERSFDEVVPWHGRPAPIRCHLGSVLAEGLLHGRDLARTLDVPWPISKREATLCLENVIPLLPLLINPQTTRDVDATIRIRLRGASSIPLRFDHGTLTLDAKVTHFDATVSADPVAFLLVAYGRSSQSSEIARGRIIAWGRKPWVALKLTSYLVTP